MKLLGGARPAIEATIPPVVFVIAWMASIMVRWPFLGIVLGAILGTKTTWRKDPVILRAYNRASWFWVAQYGVRVIQVPAAT